MNVSTRALAFGAGAAAVGVAFRLTQRGGRDVTADRVHASRTVTVRCDEATAYELWTAPERLPAFVHGLVSAERTGEDRQRWSFDVLGRARSVDVEIVAASPPERIEWRFVPRGPLAGGAAVAVQPAPGGRGTEIRFSLHVEGPTAKAAALCARVLGSSPARFAAESLRALKALVEAGEIPQAVAS
jgi:uncharacterized membrane protein